MRKNKINFLIIKIYLRYKYLFFSKGKSIDLKKTKLGNFVLTEKVSSISAYSLNRCRLYSNGIQERLEILARAYGYSNYFSLDVNDVIVDVGANIGEFAVFCAQAGCKIHAFEPDPLPFLCLQENLKKYESLVRIENCALGNFDSQNIKLFLRPESADTTIIEPNVISHYVESSARLMTFASYAKQQNLKKIKLFKCDAEGAEPEVLEGSIGVIDIIENFAIDCGPERNGQTTYRSVITILKKFGFNIITNPAKEKRHLVFASRVKQ